MTTRKNFLGEIKFEKDDVLAMRFVSAITNIRVYNFRNSEDKTNKLVYLSEHTIKTMVGNIIPAIGNTFPTSSSNSTPFP